MSYDITFCEGHDCQRREQCHRYRELIRWRADKNPNRGNLISLYKPTDAADCGLFWREKEALGG